MAKLNYVPKVPFALIKKVFDDYCKNNKLEYNCYPVNGGGYRFDIYNLGKTKHSLITLEDFDLMIKYEEILGIKFDKKHFLVDQNVQNLAELVQSYRKVMLEFFKEDIEYVETLKSIMLAERDEIEKRYNEETETWANNFSTLFETQVAESTLNPKYVGVKTFKPYDESKANEAASGSAEQTSVFDTGEQMKISEDPQGQPNNN